MNTPQDVVRNERLSRHWSIRRAAMAGGKCSHSYWTHFENGDQPLTLLMIDAVAAAFGWPETWVTDRVEAPATIGDEQFANVLRAVLFEFAELRRELAELRTEVRLARPASPAGRRPPAKVPHQA